ncbi:MarR family winged helix-turn-helix transcriptional regulator [Pseudomonas mangiferae]|uniref:MarR family transcriptional regulator n=1 Tax=Pseudomonas mangiferae TaxID=2593654 RepID=A0A553H1Q5_9PSED|nr:MarR family transcriptional regulator [Pseudomonas mangiferae]TRX75685.1 MarR family transcriptional regulator [Pseudomonas mangiferae]
MAYFDRENFPLHYSLGHLIHLANQYKDGLLDKHLSSHDVTVAQFKVLLLLARDGLDSPAALCRPLALDSGAMTRMLDRLESKGLIERTRNTEDRRQIRLSLTEQGRAFSLHGSRIAADAMNELIDPLEPGEVDELQRLLRKLLAPCLSGETST